MNYKKCALAIVLLGLAGCQSTPALKINSAVDLESNTSVNRVNRDALNYDENIDMPSNYDVNSFSKVRVAAYVDKVSWMPGSNPASVDTGMAAKLLENELARTKRFDVLTRNCTSCSYEAAYQVENTRIEGQIEQGEQYNPDYVLELSIALGSAIKEKFDHNEIIFTADVTTKLTNPTTGEIVHSFAPIRSNLPAKNYFVIGGKFHSGFNLHDPNELIQAYRDAASASIQVLVTKVMDYYPVGGRVTNFRNGRIAIDSGINQGFAVKQPVVLFLSDDGLDIPLASAEITPKKDNGAGSIIKWRSDADAQEVMQKLKAMGKDYLKSNRIYAVSVGTPEHWAL